MATTIRFEASNEVGCYMKLTNSYCLVAAGFADSTYEMIQSELGNDFPVIPITIAGMKIVGRMVAGNKNGLLVPSSITEEEENVLKAKLPTSVTLKKIDDKLSALGNVIIANDRVALMHPDVDSETELAV